MSNRVSSFDPRGPLDGTEIVGLALDGANARTTTGEIAAMIAVGAESQVASLELLRALPIPAGGNSLRVTDHKSGGFFVFLSGDQSALMTAYAGSGLYEAPDDDPTGASGIWARQTLPIVDSGWSEAEGDGVADDGPEYEGSVNAAIAAQVPLYSAGASHLLATWTRLELPDKLTLRGPNSLLKGPVAATSFANPAGSFDVEGMTFERWSSVFTRASADAGSVDLARFVGNYVKTTTAIPLNFEVPTDGALIANNKFEDINSGTYAVRIGWNDYASQDTWKRNLLLFNLFDDITGNLSATSSIFYGKDNIQIGNRVYNLQGSGLEAHGFYTKTRYGSYGFDCVDGVDSSGGTDITGRTVKGGNRILVDRGAWATAQNYVIHDGVTQGGTTYIATEIHTSGVFATDLAAGKWTIQTPEGYANIVFGGMYKNIGSPGVRGTGLRSQTTENRFAFGYAEDTGVVGFGMDAPAGNMGQMFFCRSRWSASVANMGFFLSQGGYGNSIIEGESDGALTAFNIADGANLSSYTRVIGGFANLPATGVCVNLTATVGIAGLTVSGVHQRGGQKFMVFNATPKISDLRINDNVVPVGVTLFTGVMPASMSGRHIQRAVTTDNTVNNVIAFTLADNSAYLIDANFLGIQTGGGANRAFRHQQALVYRTGGGAATLTGSTDIIASTKSDATWGVMEIFVSGNDVRIRVQGKAAVNINWIVQANIIAVDGA